MQSGNCICGPASHLRGCARVTAYSPGNYRVSRLFPVITDGAKRRYLLGNYSGPEVTFDEACNL
jgi:hypothetical protein